MATRLLSCWFIVSYVLINTLLSGTVAQNNDVAFIDTLPLATIEQAGAVSLVVVDDLAVVAPSLCFDPTTTTTTPTVLPAVTSVSPNHGSETASTPVVVRGQNLLSLSSATHCRVGAVGVPAYGVSDHCILCLVPPRSLVAATTPSAVDLHIVDDGASLLLFVDRIHYPGAGPFRVTQVTPELTIAGTSLDVSARLDAACEAGHHCLDACTTVSICLHFTTLSASATSTSLIPVSRRVPALCSPTTTPPAGILSNSTSLLSSAIVTASVPVDTTVQLQPDTTVRVGVALSNECIWASERLSVFAATHPIRSFTRRTSSYNETDLNTVSFTIHPRTRSGAVPTHGLLDDFHLSSSLPGLNMTLLPPTPSLMAHPTQESLVYRVEANDPSGCGDPVAIDVTLSGFPVTHSRVWLLRRKCSKPPVLLISLGVVAGLAVVMTVGLLYQRRRLRALNALSKAPRVQDLFGAPAPRSTTSKLDSRHARVLSLTSTTRDQQQQQQQQQEQQPQQAAWYSNPIRGPLGQSRPSVSSGGALSAGTTELFGHYSGASTPRARRATKLTGFGPTMARKIVDAQSSSAGASVDTQSAPSPSPSKPSPPKPKPSPPKPKPSPPSRRASFLWSADANPLAARRVSEASASKATVGSGDIDTGAGADTSRAGSARGPRLPTTPPSTHSRTLKSVTVPPKKKRSSSETRQRVYRRSTVWMSNPLTPPTAVEVEESPTSPPSVVTPPSAVAQLLAKARTSSPSVLKARKPSM